MQAKVLEAIVHAIQRVFLLGIVAGALAVILAIFFVNRGAIDLNQQQALDVSETPQATESMQGDLEKGVEIHEC